MSARLVTNPFADIHVHPPPTELPVDLDAIELITVTCPVRGRGVLVHELDREGSPDLFGFFLHLIEQEGELELDASAPIALPLAAIGFLVPEDQVFEWPRFRVPLPPVPALVAGASWRVAADLLVQDRFELHPDVDWPDDHDDQVERLGCFADGPALWVGDQARGVSAYWLDHEQAARIAALRPGDPAPALPAELAAALVSVGALVPAGWRADPLARFAGLAPGFAVRRHVVARALLAPVELEALRAYHRALLDAGLVRPGGRQGGRRSSEKDPIARFVQARMAPVMAAVAGRAVAPTSSYFASYTDGADLAPHADREDAELGISLQLDYHPPPPPGQPTGWPLCFTVDGAAAVADLAVGDAVLYRGHELVHHRAALPAGHRSSHLVLEYVPVDLPGSRV